MYAHRHEGGRTIRQYQARFKYCRTLSHQTYSAISTSHRHLKGLVHVRCNLIVHSDHARSTMPMLVRDMAAPSPNIDIALDHKRLSSLCFNLTGNKFCKLFS